MRFASSVPVAVGTLAMIALVVPLGGCPGDEPSACTDYSPPASFDAQNPAVSFSNDVMPIFAQSCAFSSCHGSASGSSNGVFLGGTDASRVHQAIVDVRSTRLAEMSLVKPGDPRESFLLRKMDGSQCALDDRCTGGTCGQSMPQNDDPLPLEARDAVRRWIAQGAKND
ncbi:MAG: hypothetical protein KIS78_23130 [Labilithrix sp.]|nr:hypothetical protein [Labilithrix sp.]MCW5835313.1 hypothetical protein [Labilithrix sp.]